MATRLTAGAVFAAADAAPRRVFMVASDPSEQRGTVYVCVDGSLSFSRCTRTFGAQLGEREAIVWEPAK